MLRYDHVLHISLTAIHTVFYGEDVLATFFGFALLILEYLPKIYYIIHLVFAYVSLAAQVTLTLQYDSKVNVFDRR